MGTKVKPGNPPALAAFSINSASLSVFLFKAIPFFSDHISGESAVKNGDGKRWERRGKGNVSIRAFCPNRFRSLPRSLIKMRRRRCAIYMTESEDMNVGEVDRITVPGAYEFKLSRKIRPLMIHGQVVINGKS